VASQLGGSAYFDGNDSLQVPSNSLFNYSSTDMTVELWLYLLTIPAEAAILELGTGATGDLQLVVVSSTGGISFGTSGRAKTWATVTVNQWYHIAGVKSGSTYYLYLNGTRYTTESGNSTSSSTAVNIGSRNNTTNYLTGYISNYKISNYARYNTTTIPVPTTPAVPDANTSLLLNFTGAGIVDSTSKNVVETVGKAQINTTQSNFARSSISFASSGDGLNISDSDLFNMSSGDFTVEMWARANSLGSEQFLVGQNNYSSYYAPFRFQFDSSSRLVALISTSGSSWGLRLEAGSPLSNNTWYYVVLVRNGTSFKIYVNGSQYDSGNLSGALYNSSDIMRIGWAAISVNNFTFNGYIQDLRITRGYARYATGTGNTMVFSGTSIPALPTLPFPLA